MLYRLSYVGGLGSDSICYILGTSFMATVDGLLERARERLKRVDAKQAAAELAAGALLVDTRTDSQRAAQGEIPGARVIDRTVLEWRLDPTSPWRIPEAVTHEVRVMVVCSEGYSSSLAAASLQDLGLVNATDVIGGFQAWKAAGLPVEL
jgi:rhodanese-related sulfurtransferase